jgi:hypothetical protein
MIESPNKITAPNADGPRQFPIRTLWAARVGEFHRSATLLFMKTTTIGAVLTVSLLLAGCGKKTTPPSSTSSKAAPVTESAMTAWQQGDTPKAVSRFVETDWNGRPLFAANSTLSLTEDQFKALSDAERQAKSADMMSQLDSVKKLAAAVAQAGRDASAKGDPAQARKYFTSLKQCGTALDSPDCLSLVQLVGKAFKRMADTELAKIPQ